MCVSGPNPDKTYTVVYTRRDNDDLVRQDITKVANHLYLKSDKNKYHAEAIAAKKVITKNCDICEFRFECLTTSVLDVTVD